jgi:hypothetical protein
MEQGKFGEAYEIYTALSTQYPDDANLLLACARAAIAAGDTATALFIYKNLSASNPNDTELHLEAARAHYTAGDMNMAMRLGRLALAEYEKKRFQMHGTIRAGVLYDSNANQGPGSDVLNLGNWQNVLFPNIKGKGSWGAYVGANLDLGYRMSATGPWWLVGDIKGFWQGNLNDDLKDSSSREWQWGRTAVGVRRVDGKKMIDFRVKAEIFDFEFENNVSALGAEFNYTRLITPRRHLILNAGIEQHTYNHNKDHDGTFSSAGAYARFLFGESSHEFLFGANYMGATADFHDYGYDGWQALARFNFKLSNGFTVSPQISYMQAYYNGPATILESDNRRDNRLRVGADATYALNESWNIEAGYYYTKNNSNSGLYKYDQHVINLGFAWKF